MNTIYKILKYLTNNEKHSRHEVQFDIAFFIIITISLIGGIILLINKYTEEWIAFLVIEYVWALDGMRHNRS
jgi:hypothetical protein